MAVIEAHLRKMDLLRNGTPILEELNKTPEKYVNFNSLRKNISINSPKLRLTAHGLYMFGYVDERFVEEEKKGEDITEHKILEKGQKALAKYKEMLKVMKEIP
jgi:hypothetical protein